jgi:hypothetical protein
LEGVSSAWALPRPSRTFSFGTMVGGPGGYLALAALGLPLALDPGAERFVGNPAANQMLRRHYRRPYLVPEFV